MAIYDNDGIYGEDENSPAKAPAGITAIVPVSGTITTIPAAGSKGNYQENQGASPATLTTSQYNDGNSAGLLLDPGIYDLQATTQLSTLTGTTLTYVAVYVGTESGNSGTGADLTRNMLKISATFTANSDVIFSSPLYRVVVTAQTRFYPKVFADFSGGSGAVATNYLTARRV